MAMFKDFTFDGENSKDYDVYISGDAVYDAPERAMDMVQIPGRNGALALDNGYYNNIDVTYPAGCFADDQADFAAKLSRIRNMLASRHRYCRLEDAYHPDHFRMALYKSGLEVAPVARNKAGRFNVTFDAKPQRFLKSGEVVQELDADAPPTTSYGPADIVTFEGEPGDAIVHGQWPLEPVQDLHGYDAPWPAGGGKNLVFAEDRSGIITQTTIVNNFSLPTGTYTMSADLADANQIGVALRIIVNSTPSATTSFSTTTSPSRESKTFTVNDTDVLRLAVVGMTAGYNGSVSKVQIEAGSTATSYAPYSNICPITGWTGAEITRDGKNLSPTKSGSSDANGRLLVSDIGTIIEGQTYTVSLKALGVNSKEVRVQIGSNNQSAFNANTFVVGQRASRTFTASASGTLRLNTNSTAFSASTDVVDDIQLELGSPATAYEPFVGTTHDISWSDEAGTVYGGTLAYLGGNSWRLTATYAKDVYDGTESWTAQSGYGFYHENDTIQRMLDYSGAILCDKLKTFYAYIDPGYIAADAGISAFRSAAEYLGQNWVYAKGGGATTAAEFKAWLALNPITLVYLLATPVTYDLTGEELQALIGTNNIFSDTGTTTITVQSPYELMNPTLYPSKPLIRVYGSGTIQVNDITITVAEHSGYIDIDCDLMDCYRGADNMNQYVSLSGNDFPELQPGINRILLNGPDRVEITPRWWEL